MAACLIDLLTVAKEGKLNLPIVSLRTSLLYRIDNIVRVDRDLGLVQLKSGAIPFAVEMYAPADSELNEVRKALAETVRRWVMDTVEPWAVRNSLDHLVTRLLPLVSTDSFELQSVEDTYIGANGRPDFSLIARVIGDSLTGEELFEGLGACELIASSEYRSDTVELMTLPKRGQRGEDIFSMAARLTVGTIPYSNDLYLAVSAVKRVWAKASPKSFPNMPNVVTGYVIAIGHPVMPVAVRRSETGWAFGDEYASLLRESNGALPETLDAAIGQREFNTEIQRIESEPNVPYIARWIRKVVPCSLGRNAHDILSTAFVDELEICGEITKQQKRVISRYHVVQFSNDGGTRVVVPDRSIYHRAIGLMLVLSIAITLAAALAWMVLSTSPAGIVICWTMGYLLGWIGKDIYDSAWGRARLAMAILSRHRWLCIAS